MITQCQRCASPRLAHILAHCSDMRAVDFAGHEEYGYVPGDMGIGGGDDVRLTYCLDCGQIQGPFLPATHPDGAPQGGIPRE